ncbi:MAG: GTP-binding protein [Clostridia bacterium]|nr:GTP-binding protein [Clostridia bacterium]
MLKLYLFSGFLGSGKTTLVTALAKKLVQEQNQKVMLIVNDVGDVGIDGHLMRQLDTDVFELFGGCVCGQLGNLVNLLQDAGTKYPVDIILMEASGIAQPVRFLDTIKRFGPEGMAIKVLALADAERWLDLRQVVGDLLASQIKTAQLVLINKIDVVDKDVVQKVETDIRTINAEARLMTVSVNDEANVARIAEVIHCD